MSIIFEKMGIEVTHVSGGELESPDAGNPAAVDSAALSGNSRTDQSTRQNVCTDD